MIKKQKVSVEIEARARDTAGRWPAQADEQSRAPATSRPAPPLRPRDEAELRALAADGTFATAQPSKPHREVRLDPVVARVRVQARELIGIPRQVVQLALAG